MTPDIPISIAVTVLGSILSLVLPRRYALLPLALSLCLYPQGLLLPPKNLGLFPQRAIALVLLLRCILQGSIRSQFKWRLVDTVALAYYLLVLSSQLLTTRFDMALNNRIGFFLSAMVPFWCVRFLITDRDSLYPLLKAWLWAAVPLAILGLFQMRTGDSPYFRIMQHSIFWIGKPNNPWDMRELFGHTYFRASAPFLQFIMYGWYFALLLGIVTNLYFQNRRLFPWIIPLLFLPVGVAASISGGPKGFAILSVALLLCFPLRGYWRIGLGAAILAYATVMLLSNRTPMEILAQYGMDAASSWYRVALSKYTLHGGGMKGHWFTGYGEIPPAYNHFHDLCIHWVWLLVVHGIMGLVGFYALIAAAGRSLWIARRTVNNRPDEWLLWSFFSTLLATLAGMLLVALFAEMHFIYHMFLALVANADLIVRPVAATRQVALLAEYNGKPVLLRYHLLPHQALALVRPLRR